MTRYPTFPLFDDVMGVPLPTLQAGAEEQRDALASGPIERARAIFGPIACLPRSAARWRPDAARADAHQRARILRDAALRATHECRIAWTDYGNRTVNQMFAAARRQEAIGNGEQRRPSRMVELVDEVGPARDMPTIAIATRTIDHPGDGWELLESTAQINDGIIDITVTRTAYGPGGEVMSSPVVIVQQGGDAEPGDAERLQELAESMLVEED